MLRQFFKISSQNLELISRKIRDGDQDGNLDDCAGIMFIV